jgi:flagellar biosynthetic protein FliP
MARSCRTSEETKVFWSFFSKKDCFLLPILLLWAPHASAQSLSLNMAPDGAHSLTTNVVTLVAITSVLSLAPGLLVMGTAFTRLVVVLSLLRTALGLQQTPPNTVIIALSLFLTGFIMAPSFETAYRQAVQPLMAGSITEEQAFDRGVKPFRGFMEANASDRDVALFIDLAHWTPPAAAAGAEAPADPHAAALPPAKPGAVSRAVRDQLSLRVLAPAFLVSELSKAFQIGFLLFLPFLVIDIAVSAILMGMGMMMLPPVTISLPFKLIFFVMINGWEMVAGSLVRSFAT